MKLLRPFAVVFSGRSPLCGGSSILLTGESLSFIYSAGTSVCNQLPPRTHLLAFSLSIFPPLSLFLVLFFYIIPPNRYPFIFFIFVIHVFVLFLFLSVLLFLSFPSLSHFDTRKSSTINYVPVAIFILSL